MNHKIPIAKPNFGREEEEAVKAVLQSGILVSGEKTKSFEKEFAEYIGVEHAVAVTNGTIALDVALKALNLGPGDEVITSAFSFIASGNCILFQGAKPVFADINPRTFNIDPSDVAEKITSRTKAIIPIHMFGQPAEMDTLKEIAEKKEIAVIEDAAQAHGAEYKGEKAGSIGDMACFSFYATKNMTTGEGGMITTNDPKLARKARLLINHGQSQKYHHATLGYNYRMTNVAAAIGLAQLEKIEWHLRRRQEIADQYALYLKDISDITFQSRKSWAHNVFWMNSIVLKDISVVSRDDIMSSLNEDGIETRPFFHPMHTLPMYCDQNKGKVFPIAEYLSTRGINLPSSATLKKDDLSYICDSLINALRQA